MPDSPIFIDTVIIGAGQAGLAAAYYLQHHGQSFVVLDERPAIGHVWATRYDSLRLFSPAWASGLPGLPWPGSSTRYPTKDEAAAYLQRYAEHFNLPVRLGQRVTRVAAIQAGTEYEVSTAAGPTYTARNVIVCTGPYNAPRLPDFAQQLNPAIPQVHSSAYRRPGSCRAPDRWLWWAAATRPCRLAPT
ncbi:FAD-dependent oxidoreductase [Hymenobacter cellulosilyticus]|uniref:FAD-dependent oxidoreductase n=1 Tax=Hymenobacter cellulosilyticus TaxID=2932248 RepID=A0A8T9Q6S4_9BACT|nr:FAD-dependent oxidoreductase [Hymenobacter cellulosilyticus]UOQ72815.1 FAD-dependent oxidoreductase [Hymenobacter cellulosilyticus]